MRLRNRAVLFLGLAVILSKITAAATIVPNPSLSPEAVVSFQLKSLKNNNESDDGIEATFRFASPANKAITGPLPRFAKLFNAEQYKPMLQHRDAQVKLISSNDQVATVMAGLLDNDGEFFWYQFRLSRQKNSPYIDCWMTDSVVRVPGPGRSA